MSSTKFGISNVSAGVVRSICYKWSGLCACIAGY